MRHSYIDEYSHVESFIHRIEPRIKIIAFFLFILSVIFTPADALISFVSYGVLIGVLIFLSKIPMRFVFERSLVILPFLLAILAPLPFIKHAGYDKLTIFYSAVVKAYLAMLSMLILISSARFSDLLRAFERLRCPRLIIMILSFMYRYIFVIQDEAMRMNRAKDSRLVKPRKSSPIKIFSNIIGVLFLRSFERAESTYLAMCSRGFDGNIHTINNLKIKRLDVVFLSAMIIILSSILLFSVK